jgi:hypothetical protein
MVIESINSTVTPTHLKLVSLSVQRSVAIIRIQFFAATQQQQQTTIERTDNK